MPSTLVIVDSAVEARHSLINGVLSHTEVIVLSPTENGVEQITQILHKFPHLNALHLISHGSPGCVQVGNSELSLETLKTYASQLQTWSVSSILLYGCNVAAGDAGTEFISKLHHLTGAKIAASAKRTGSAALGGDWKLEVTTGNFDTSPAFESEAMQAYPSVLVAPELDLDGDNSSGASGNAFRNIFIPGGSAVSIVDFNTPSDEGGDTVITEPDSGQLSGATITLTNAKTGDVLNVGTLPQGISIANNTGSQITLSGNASLADYEAALEAITFNSTAANPNIATRDITVQVTDAQNEVSNTATSSIDIKAGEVLIAATSAPSVTTNADGQITALWKDVGEFNGTQINIRATVIDKDAGTSNPTFTTASNDLKATSTSAGRFVIRWDLINDATGDPIIGDVSFTIKDLDGQNNLESASANLDSISEYTVNDPTNLATSIADNFITLEGTDPKQGASDVEAAVRLKWLGVSSFEAAYYAIRSNRGFEHDGNLEFSFTNPVTVALPKVDLDASNRATGFNYATTFASEGSAVAIADTDTSISDSQNPTLQSATVTLTNAQEGDELSVAGPLPGGITASTSSANGQIVLTLSGTASLADYETAIEAVRFDNSLSGPSRVERRIEVSTNNGDADSNLAVSTVSITDNTPPSVVSLARQTPADEITNADSVVFRVSFDENVQNVDESDFTLSGAAAADGTISEVTQVAGDIYDVRVTGVNNSNGTVNLDFAPAQNITDEVGSDLSNTPPSVDESYTLDNIPPAEPTVESQATPDTTPTIVGTATVDPGETLTVAVNGVTYTAGEGDLTRNGNNWSLTIPNALAEGTYNVTATVTDEAGNATGDTTSGELVVDTTPPAAPTVDSLTTSDTTPEITGTATVNQGEALTVVIDGVTYTVEDGNLSLSGSDFSLTIPDANALAEGTYEVAATVTDTAGNATGDTTTNELTVDITNPGAPTVDDLTTNTTTPTLTGTATVEAGETLTVAVGGNTYTEGDGNLTRNGTNWSLTIPNANAIAEGTYEVAATVTDAAGNATGDTTSNELVVDTTPPAEPTVNSQATSDTTPEITGTATVGEEETLTVVVDGVTYTVGDGDLSLDGTNWSLVIPEANALAEGTYNVAATVTDEAGNATGDTTNSELTVDTSAPIPPTVNELTTNNTTPTLTGTATVEAGETFTVAVGGNTYTEGDGNLTRNGTNWSLSIPDANALAENTYDVTATVTDAAGNTSSDTTSGELTVDTTAPITPTVNGLTTNTTTPTITGTATVGEEETLTVAVNGVNYTVGDGDLTLDGTDWSLTIPAANALAEGTYEVVATVADEAGNTSSDPSNSELVVDTTPPAAPSLDLLPSSDTGASDSDDLTNEDTPTIQVALNGMGAAAPVAGDTVRLVYDSTEAGSALLSASDITNGYVDIATDDLGANGDRTLTATITDVAGNTSAGSPPLTLTLDQTLPVLQSGVIDGSTLILNYDEPLDGGSDFGVDNYTVSVNGETVEVSAVDADGSTVTLTLATSVNGT